MLFFLAPRRRAAVDVALIGACLVAGALLEHRGSGVESRLLLAAALALAPLAQACSALAGRAPAAHPLLAALAVLPLATLVRGAPSDAALALLGAAAFLSGAPALRLEGPSAPATRAERALPAALAVLAVLVDLAARPSPGVFEVWLLLLACEGWGAGAEPRSAARTSSLAARFALALGASWSRAHPASPESARLVAGLVAAAALLAACEVALVRGFRPRSEAEALRRRREGLARAGGFAAALVALLALGEGLLRVLPTPYAHWTLGAAPGSTWHEPGGRHVYEGLALGPREEPSVYGVETVWNAEGFHDTDHARAKRPGTVRILVLGDSFVEAVQVPLADLFHRRLEAELAATTPAPLALDVMAYGWSTWRKPEEEAALERAAPYAPDLVLVELLDGVELAAELPPAPEDRLAAREAAARDRALVALREAAIRRGLAFVPFAASGTLRRLAAANARALGFGEEVFYREAPPPDWLEAAERLAAKLVALQAAARRQGAELVVVISPIALELRALAHPESIPRGASPLRLARLEAELCRRSGVPCIDLVARFAARGGADLARLHLEFDQHWSPLGHRWAAEETAAALRESELWARLLERAAKR